MKIVNEPKMIREFGLFVGVVCAALGAYLSWKAGHLRPVLPAVGAYFLAGALVYQPMLRPVFRVWMQIAGALGWFNTRLLLGLIYYAIFTPMSLVMKLMGRDALRLSRQSDASLWTAKPVPVGGKSRYFRQF